MEASKTCMEKVLTWPAYRRKSTWSRFQYLPGSSPSAANLQVTHCNRSEKQEDEQAARIYTTTSLKQNKAICSLVPEEHAAKQVGRRRICQGGHHAADGRHACSRLHCPKAQACHALDAGTSGHAGACPCTPVHAGSTAALQGDTADDSRVFLMTNRTSVPGGG